MYWNILQDPYFGSPISLEHKKQDNNESQWTLEYKKQDTNKPQLARFMVLIFFIIPSIVKNMTGVLFFQFCDVIAQVAIILKLI
jgi:hypothetical protein